MRDSATLVRYDLNKCFYVYYFAAKLHILHFAHTEDMPAATTPDTSSHLEQQLKEGKEKSETIWHARTHTYSHA